MSDLLVESPKILTADSRGCPPTTGQIHLDLIRLRKAVGGLKAEEKSGVSFAVKSAKTLLNKFRKACDHYNINCYPVACVFSALPKEKGTMCYGIYTIRIVSSDGSYVDIVAAGMGADSQDKASGKFNTYAWKYALIYALILPDGDVKEQYENDPEDTDDMEFPTGEPGGIEAVLFDGYLVRLEAADNLDKYTAIVNEMKQHISAKVCKERAAEVLKEKNRIEKMGIGELAKESP